MKYLIVTAFVILAAIACNKSPPKQEAPVIAASPSPAKQPPLPEIMKEKKKDQKDIKKK